MRESRKGARLRVAAFALALTVLAGAAVTLLWTRTPPDADGAAATVLPASYGTENLGMILMDIEEEQARYYSAGMGGVYVLAVVSGSAADRAGVRAGDMVLSLGGEACDTTAVFSRLLARWGGTGGVALIVLREEARLSLPLAPTAP